MSYLTSFKECQWVKIITLQHNYLSLIIIVAAILISCIHLNVFYYSYDTPKWFVFDMLTSVFILYFFHNKQKILFSYLGILILIFSYYMLISIVWAPNKFAAAEFSVRFINACLFIYAITRLFSAKQLEAVLLNACFWSAFLFSCLFYIERYVLGHTQYNVGNYSPIGFMNNAGAVFNVWIPALVLFSIKQYQNKNKYLLIFSIITTLAIVSILMEAATRGTIIGLTIFEIIVFLMVFRHNKKQACLYITITTLLLTGMLTYKLSDALQSGRLEGKLIALSTNIAAASGQRIQLYKNTMAMTLDNKMGVGINNFEFVHPKYAKAGTPQTSPYVNEKQILTTPHNLVLKIFSEVGLVFGSVFVLILLYLLMNAFLNALKGNYTDKWLFVGFGATLFHSMLSAVLLTPVSLFFSCLLMGLILARTQFKTKGVNCQIPLSLKALFILVPVFLTLSMYSNFLSFSGYKQHDHEKMKTAVMINPYNTRALYNLSNYELAANRNPVQSLHYIDQFLRSYPYHISGLQIKAERHYQLKEYRLATQTVETLLDIYPSYKTANRLKLQINRKINNDPLKEK